MEKELIAIALSLFATVLSGASALYSWRSSRASILGHFVQLERSLENTPLAFRFHGISEDDIRDVGITAEELSYLVASFTCGNFYHHLLAPFNKNVFPEGHYRFAMCASEPFQKAWPLVRKMLSPSNFVIRVDRTIELLKSRR